MNEDASERKEPDFDQDPEAWVADRSRKMWDWGFQAGAYLAMGLVFFLSYPFPWWLLFIPVTALLLHGPDWFEFVEERFNRWFDGGRDHTT